MRLNTPARAAAVLAATVLLASGCLSGGPSEPPSVTRSLAAQATATAVALPRPRHVVVVVEENHSYADILDGSAAPYLTSLVRQGASFTASYAVAHPSEPNYLALFSGSTQGLTDDSCPHTYPGPTLASELLAAHLSFAGYSESMPSTGYSGCASGDYARKHNPWADFPGLPYSINRTWAQFPHAYDNLPTVSFVIPNVKNDMHSGSVQRGDAWLRHDLAGYVAWARAHDSLLVVTWDEDDGGAANRIPTVIVGAGVRPGGYAEPVDHYRLLRTLEALYGLPPIGLSADRAPVTDIWRRSIKLPRIAIPRIAITRGAGRGGGH